MFFCKTDAAFGLALTSHHLLSACSQCAEYLREALMYSPDLQNESENLAEPLLFL
jgi:hypothetical protein